MKGIISISNQVSLLDDWPSDIKNGNENDLLDFLKECKDICFCVRTYASEPGVQSLALAVFGNSEVQFVMNCTNINITKYKYFFRSNLNNWHISNSFKSHKILHDNGIFPTNMQAVPFVTENKIISLSEVSHIETLRDAASTIKDISESLEIAKSETTCRS